MIDPTRSLTPYPREALQSAESDPPAPNRATPAKNAACQGCEEDTCENAAKKTPAKKTLLRMRSQEGGRRKRRLLLRTLADTNGDPRLRRKMLQSQAKSTVASAPTPSPGPAHRAVYRP